MAILPPPPNINADASILRDWNNKLRDIINKTQTNLSWSSINKSGSNLADLETRNHEDLNNLQGGISGEYYHLTQAEHTKIGTLLAGITGTVDLAKLTTSGTAGSLTVVNGIITGYTAPT